MVSMKSWMLGAALMAGAMGLGATTAQAAQFRVEVGAPVAYVPPCPGPGYFWTAGYYANGYWVPGRWEFRGFVGGGRGWDRGRVAVYNDHFRGRDDFRDRGHFDRDRGHDRGHDRFRR